VRALAAAILFATLFIAGCAVPTRTNTSNQSESASWRGRLAVRIEADQPESQPQSFSAGFELTGTPLTGALALYTPLGSTAAALSWSPQTAIMRTNGDVRYFATLEDLIKQAVGTDIPVAALFAWLAGENMNVKGWRADLSQHAHGRITARRTEPAPVAELRLVLEQ
jgi:outer membrane lipoprotein LolB